MHAVFVGTLFVSDPPSKDAAFVPRVRPCEKTEGVRWPERRRTENVGPRDDIYDRCRRMAESLILIVSRSPCHPRCSASVPPRKDSLSVCEKTFQISCWPIDFLPPSWIFFNSTSLPLLVDNTALLLRLYYIFKIRM